MQDWIKVEDGLPEYGKSVLVFGEHRLGINMGGPSISIGRRQDLTGTSLEARKERHQDANQFISMSYVTHWMPLPDKPSNK